MVLGKGQGEQGAAGDHKGLVKIPRIFLALPNPASLARVLDKSALYDGRARFQKTYLCKPAGPLRAQGSWIDQCLCSPIPPKGDCMNKNTEAPPWLPWWELRVGDGRGKVGGRSRVGKPDDRTVDVDALGTVGSTTGARQQVGAGGRQVEDDDLIDLPRVKPRVDGLLRP